MKPYLQLIRPYQYTKNALIFFPAFFAFKLKDIHLLSWTFLAFLGFCFMASSVYILNDYFDREDDARHPEKKNRPLAAGTVSTQGAWILLVALLCLGLGIFAMINLNVFLLAIFYFVMNIAYTFKLKHIAIIDISILAVGFVLRLYIGAGVGDIVLSMWINLMTFLLALFLGLAKRRSDVLLAEEGNKTRKSIDGYNLEFINSAMMMMASIVVVSYIFYTITPEIQTKYHSQNLYLTVFFVLLGILRYMQITFVERRSGNPSKILLSDIFLQLTIGGWLLAFFVILYY